MAASKSFMKEPVARSSSEALSQTARAAPSTAPAKARTARSSAGAPHPCGERLGEPAERGGEVVEHARA